MTSNNTNTKILSSKWDDYLYSNGKVCLSILNTWAGESWSSCQSIHSILFTLVTILCDNPLLNEPGVREQHSELNKYNYLVFYKNIEFSIVTLICLINDIHIQHNVVKKKTAHTIEIMRKFKDIVNSAFQNNKTQLLELINANKVKYANFIVMTNPFEMAFYNLSYSLNYGKLADLIKSVF